jgi:magnesium-transporting ATPase (P-type)
VENFQDLINIIGKWIFNLAIPLAVIVIIYAGVTMLTAGGNPANFKKGAEALKYAVIGLAVVLIGKGFVTLIKSILSLRE